MQNPCTIAAIGNTVLLCLVFSHLLIQTLFVFCVGILVPAKWELARILPTDKVFAWYYNAELELNQMTVIITVVYAVTWLYYMYVEHL